MLPKLSADKEILDASNKQFYGEQQRVNCY